MWGPLSTASVVFFVLYALVFVALNYLLWKKTISIKSRWALLYFHCAVRLAAQGCGIAFGITGFRNTDLFVAFLVLCVRLVILGSTYSPVDRAAEGYFTLVLTGYRFLVAVQQCNLHDGVSFLEARMDGKSFWQRFAHSMSIAEIRKSPLNAMHIALIVANGLIISGGSQLAADYANDRLSQESIDKSIALRSAGQAIFLTANAALFAAILYTFRLSRRDLGHVHPTLIILAIASPFLLVRGVYGVLQAANIAGDFFDNKSYSNGSLSNHFVVEETLMATLMEWSSCALFLSSVITSHQDLRKESDPAPTTEENEGQMTEKRAAGDVQD